MDLRIQNVTWSFLNGQHADVVVSCHGDREAFDGSSASQRQGVVVGGAVGEWEWAQSGNDTDEDAGLTGEVECWTGQAR